MSFKGLSVFMLTVLIFCSMLDVRGQNRRKAERLFSDAQSALQSTEESKVIDILNKCLQADSTFADGWGLLGDISTDLQDFETAVSSYKKAIFYNPAYSSLYMALAQNELKTGRYAEAKTDAEKYISESLSQSNTNLNPIPKQSQIIGARLVIQKAETT